MDQDAKSASLKARDYLYSLRGKLGIRNFQIENAQYDEKSKVWTIGCSFQPSMFRGERLKYGILVSDDGNIKSANKIS